MNTLKNIIGIICGLLISCVAVAQNTTIQFVGKDRTGNDYVRLNHVSVFDEDQLWHEMLYYPDTSLFLGPVSVEDYAMQDFRLMQNVPNPFEGITDIALSLPDVRDVTLEIYDILGKVLVKQSFHSLQEGTHLFRASMTSPQTYLLSATTKDGKTSIKMVNEGVAATNSIEYIGMTNPQGGLSLFLNESKGAGSYPFNIGDKMKYTGYALIDDEMRSSEVVQKKQYNNETIQLKFDVERPVVETRSCYSLAAEAACFNAEVTSDNNASVTERGFCYATHNAPTLNDSWISAGTGVGLYTTNVTDLTAGTVYYVRAYAINAIGLSYGSSKSIRTQDTIPEVTTTVPSQITATSFVSGGEVLTDNGSSVTARGVCWSVLPNPTITDDFTNEGSGLGSFTSNINGLNCGTTYYVRAYAINSVGTAYGENHSVTTGQELPVVSTANISDVTDNSAICGGNVTYDGCSPVITRGVCWSTSQNPTVNDSHTTDGTGTGSFTSNLTGLSYATTYYVRAYATNGIGTSYGETMTFTTNPILPTVSTDSITDITATSFVCGGNVSSDGGAEVTTRGLCWSTIPNPTIDDSSLILGSGLGTFTGTVTGLTCGTTYYVRAFSTNSVGTAYGEEHSLSTLFPSIPEVELYTANINNGLNIVTQAEVMAENCSAVTTRGVCWDTLQNPTVNNNHTIEGSGTGSFTSNITDLTAGATYYVRAYATNDIGTAYSEEIIVTIPNYPTIITEAVSSITYTAATCGGNVTSDGGATVTARGVCWSTSQNPTINNSHTTNGSGMGIFTSSMTGLASGTTYYVRAYATNSTGTTYGEQRSFTTLAIMPPTVTTDTVSSITSTSATCGGNVTSDGGATVTARGVCLSTSQNPTVSDSHTTNGSGTGSFTSNITGLTAGTTYYVRAYATNSVGTSYGEQRSFTTANGDGEPCPGAATVTDYDNNTYNTVKIGNQCWMKENLRTTHYSNGTSIALGSSTSTSTAYRYYPNNSSSNVSTYGYLYNWKAVMRNFSSSSANPSGVQGICPTGWHVPSGAEWTQLTNYVSSQSQYQCGSSSSKIAKAMASTTGWNSSSETCAVGNNPSTNNATGFSARPAGDYHGGSYEYFGYYAYFWSATELNDNNAYYRTLLNNYAYVGGNLCTKTFGFSVRCVKD